MRRPAAYERLTRADGRTALLMISPPRADAPCGALRQALSRDRASGAATSGRSSPWAGPARPGHLGAGHPGRRTPTPASRSSRISATEPFVDADGPIAERYLEAVALLARLHATRPALRSCRSDDSIYAIPPYDLDALLIEAELVIDWYAPSVAKVAVPASGRGRPSWPPSRACSTRSWRSPRPGACATSIRRT